MSVCRLCLSARRALHGLFPLPSPLLDKIHFCLPLEISQSDRLPKKICDACVLKINDMCEYLNVVRNAEKELLARSLNLSILVECAISDGALPAEPSDRPATEPSRIESNVASPLVSERFRPPNAIKEEPGETVSLDETANFSKYVSKHTQTDPAIVDGEASSGVRLKREIDSPSRESADSDAGFDPRDGSDDDVALNEILKARPKTEGNEAPPEAESRKRKNDPDAKKSRGRPRGSSNGKRSKDNRSDAKSESLEIETLDCEDALSNRTPEESDKRWQCLTCFAYEKNRANLLQHYKDHVENPSDISKYPMKSIISEEDIKSEIDDCALESEAKSRSEDYIRVKSKEFSEDPAYQCLKCYKLFINRKSVMRHLICHDDSRPFPCNICGRTYKRAYEILLHGRAHSGVKTLFCRYELCSYSTAYRGALLSHHKRHEPDYKYTCEVCKKGFDVLTWFTEHKNVHTGEKPFSCNLCGKSFIYSRYLASHRKSVHPETNDRKLLHRCEICNEEFPFRKKLQRHIQRVHGEDFETLVLCDICGKRLSSKEHLKFHRRIHTGEKPHNCRTCGKSFVKKCNLTLHERIHSGERPHVCSHCGKAFSQRSTLVIHERYHSGARPYQCEICSKAFVAKGLLSMHQKNCS